MRLTATIIRSVEAGIRAELRHIECAVAAGTVTVDYETDAPLS